MRIYFYRYILVLLFLAGCQPDKDPSKMFYVHKYIEPSRLVLKNIDENYLQLQIQGREITFYSSDYAVKYLYKELSEFYHDGDFYGPNEARPSYPINANTSYTIKIISKRMINLSYGAGSLVNDLFDIQYHYIPYANDDNVIILTFVQKTKFEEMSDFNSRDKYLIQNTFTLIPSPVLGKVDFEDFIIKYETPTDTLTTKTYSRDVSMSNL